MPPRRTHNLFSASISAAQRCEDENRENVQDYNLRLESRPMIISAMLKLNPEKTKEFLEGVLSRAKLVQRNVGVLSSRRSRIIANARVSELREVTSQALKNLRKKLVILKKIMII